MTRSVAVVFVLVADALACAQATPSIRVYGNAFQAFQIVRRLKDIEAKVVIKLERVDFAQADGKGFEHFLAAWPELVADFKEEVQGRDKAMLERVTKAMMAPEGDRIEELLKLIEAYLEIKEGASSLVFIRAEEVTARWVRRDKRFTFEKE